MDANAFSSAIVHCNEYIPSAYHRSANAPIQLLTRFGIISLASSQSECTTFLRFAQYLGPTVGLSAEGPILADQSANPESSSSAPDTVKPHFRVPCPCRFQVRTDPGMASVHAPPGTGLTPRPCRRRMHPTRRHPCRMDATAGHYRFGCGRGRAAQGAGPRPERTLSNFWQQFVAPPRFSCLFRNIIMLQPA